MTPFEKMQEKQRTLAVKYKDTFASEAGKVVLRDLESFILERPQFFAEDIATDALLREGARHLLSYIRSHINQSIK